MANETILMKGPTLPTIPAEPETGESPTVFQDYGGNDFNGEPGAVAVNDNWENTVYDYVPRFAPTIPSIPTFTGAGDEAVISTRTQLTNALNNASIKKIFVEKGTDIFGSPEVEITSVSGTEESPRWILYYDPDDVNKDLTEFKPWDLPVGSSSRAQLPALRFFGTSSHYYIVGINFGKVGSSTKQRMGYHQDSVRNMVWYRCCSENSTSHPWNVNSASCQDITAYQCVSHSHDLGCLQPDNTWACDPKNDITCWTVNAGTRIRVVSCEGWDHLGDFFQCVTGSLHDCVLEDCDSYVNEKHWCNSDGTPNVNGTHWMGEQQCDLKRLNHNSTGVMRIYGNRAWGYRRTASGSRHNGGGGSVPVGNSQTSEIKRNIDVRWNVYSDFDTSNAIRMVDGATVTEGGFPTENHSYARNIYYNFRCHDPLLMCAYNSTELYLNTFRDCPVNDTFLVSFFRQTASIIDGVDIMGNALLNVTEGVWGSQSNLDSTAKIGYNLYGGTYTVFNKDYGGDQTFPGSSGINNLNMGDFRYLRKKLTGPEIAVIPGIVPTSSTPSAVRTMVPTSGADEIGSRDIGVEDAG